MHQKTNHNTLRLLHIYLHRLVVAANTDIRVKQVPTIATFEDHGVVGNLVFRFDVLDVLVRGSSSLHNPCEMQILEKEMADLFSSETCTYILNEMP